MLRWVWKIRPRQAKMNILPAEAETHQRTKSHGGWVWQDNLAGVWHGGDCGCAGRLRREFGQSSRYGAKHYCGVRESGVISKGEFHESASVHGYV